MTDFIREYELQSVVVFLMAFLFFTTLVKSLELGIKIIERYEDWRRGYKL